MRSEYASSPTRGSRLVGLLSMIMTSVFGSGFEEQEVSAKQAARINMNHAGTAVLTCAFAAPRRTWLHIGNLPENGRSFGSRGRRHIRRPPVPGLIRQQSESVRFFGF